VIKLKLKSLQGDMHPGTHRKAIVMLAVFPYMELKKLGRYEKKLPLNDLYNNVYTQDICLLYKRLSD
jgi:hypothetical protein